MAVADPLTYTVALRLSAWGAFSLFSLLHQREALSLDDQALALLTCSETATIGLVAAPGAPAAAHGGYRGRIGSKIAVRRSLSAGGGNSELDLPRATTWR